MTVESLAEEKRVERWHATYNAALSGLFASMNHDTVRADDINDGFWHRVAVRSADIAHGPLVKEP